MIIAGFVASVMLLVSWFGGRGIILGVSGAKKIDHNDHPQLFNVVEEMAIAAGVKMPDVYLIDDSAPNAFATGRDPDHAAVAITTGLLEKLDRDELQGVMAHEMSHVRNFDIRFAMLMAVLAGTIVLMCDMFWRMAFYGRAGRSRSSRSGGGRGGGGQVQAVLMIAAILLAVLAPIIAKIIQLALSRQREYLADVSAAELTRYPEGLARALEKISGDTDVLEAANRATEHLYIVSPVMAMRGREASVFSTHPPVAERVRRLRSIVPAASGA
ncbi:M48 family metallopeptidase [Candidatus Sumerlaeota bacterium]|nr:M48 family metallopeptidase [Candidatus Sumerlaeota bacterium]